MLPQIRFEVGKNKTEIDCDLGLICKYLMLVRPQVLNVNTHAFFIFFSFGKLNEFWVAFEPRFELLLFSLTSCRNVVPSDREDGSIAQKSWSILTAYRPESRVSLLLELPYFS